MLWLLVCLAPLGAVIARLLTLRRRPEIWWLAFTFTLVGIIAGSMFLANESAVNEFLGVANVSYLLSCLSFTAAAGSVTLYVHTLRHDQPSASVLWLLASGTVTTCLALLVIWLASPVHQVEFGRFRGIPLSPTMVAFEWLHHLVFLPVMSNVAICSFSLARRTLASDPARRVGLLMIGVGSAIDVVAHLLYLARASLQPIVGPPALGLATAADIVTVASMFSVCAGTTALLAVPQLLNTARAFSLAMTLRPLWRRTRQLYPEVAMRGGWRTRSRVTLQAERMLIEIADAMRLLPVAEPTVCTDPYVLIADAFKHPPAAAEGRPVAAARLPTPTSRLEEEQQMLVLAHHYNTGISYAS